MGWVVDLSTSLQKGIFSDLQMEWLKDMGFGGIMVWSVDMDDFSGRCGAGKFPLLNVLNEELKDYKVQLEYDGPYESYGPRGAYTTKDRKYSQW